MPKPATRVLAVLELLQSHGQVSGAELARRLEVDGRTLRRYIATLEEMGIPITTEQGRYGGYRLVPGYKLPPMMFTGEEAQALALGLLAARGLGLTDAAPAIESAQSKLDRVLPDGLRRSAAAMRGTIALHTKVPVVAAESKLVRLLSESAQTRHTAHLTYRSAEGVQSARGFDVYGLVFRAGRWYVVGHCHLRDGLRTLRLDRVADAEVGERTFERPEGFDPVAYLTRALATIPRAQAVEVKLETDLDTARSELPECLGTLEPCEGGVLLKGSTDHVEWFARRLMAAPFAFDVRSPDELSRTLLELAEGLAGRIRRGAPGNPRGPAPGRPSRNP